MSATTFPLAWSMRVTVRASWLATQSDPPPTARLCGLAPVVTGRPASRLVSGSIRATLSPPPPELVTQTAPGVAARSSGARPTVMVATVRPDARSMRVSASLPAASRSPGATRAADGDDLGVGRDPQGPADDPVGRGVDPDHCAGARQHPEHAVGHGHAAGAGKGDDRGEAAPVEGGHGGTGVAGRGWRL